MKRNPFLPPACLAAACMVLGMGHDAAAEPEECGRWYAPVSMVGDGGMALNARACSGGDGPGSSFQITCDGAELRIRFWPEAPATAGDYTGATQDFLFSTGGAGRRVFTTYEALDGAFAASLETYHPVIEMMKSGLELQVSDPSRKLPDYRISLAGSRKAIDKVIAGCR